jgi:hypothetical protein
MRFVAPILLAAALAVLPACADAKTLVSFEQSGGIAGVSNAVTVTTTGRVSEGGADEHARKLRASTLSRLRRLLSAADWDHARPGRSSCADCFSYVVRYHGRRAVYDDSQAKRVPRSVRAVVSELLRISRGGR